MELTSYFNFATETSVLAWCDFSLQAQRSTLVSFYTQRGLEKDAPGVGVSWSRSRHGPSEGPKRDRSAKVSAIYIYILGMQTARIGESVGLIIRLIGMVISPGRHGGVVVGANLHTGEQGVTHPVAAPASEVVDTHEVEEETAMRLEVEQLEAEVEQLEVEFQTRHFVRLMQVAAMEEVDTIRHVEEERLKAIAHEATRMADEDQEAQRRKKEELRRLAAMNKEIARWEAGAATAIQRRQRGIVARQRVASKKRMRADWCILRPPDAFDVCILRKQARPALTVIQAHSQIMTGYAREHRESHRCQLLRNLEYLEAQVGEYLEANHRLSRQRLALRTIMELVHGQHAVTELVRDEFEA